MDKIVDLDTSRAIIRQFGSSFSFLWVLAFVSMAKRGTCPWKAASIVVAVGGPGPQVVVPSRRAPCQLRPAADPATLTLPLEAVVGRRKRALLVSKEVVLGMEGVAWLCARGGGRGRFSLPPLAVVGREYRGGPAEAAFDRWDDDDDDDAGLCSPNTAWLMAQEARWYSWLMRRISSCIRGPKGFALRGG